MSYTNSDDDLPTRAALVEAGIDPTDAEIVFEDGTRAVWDDVIEGWQFAS